ncbi:hypothetical protein SmJEL517_g05768 [Synchytrium microbalum]|uniref:Uncharacterized protein n=1 Tax=Synchytrium microbalum TaxID=1806994 RepID=A0A507BTV3_9FUNG|nr:uncharacterized protein SmJEL517_g05768 [Synchytrium microbalum]TPX30748.1 hypothetical protein SmJEL517_g05768 [Synchytrium microbalum]
MTKKLNSLKPEEAESISKWAIATKSFIDRIPTNNASTLSSNEQITTTPRKPPSKDIEDDDDPSPIPPSTRTSNDGSSHAQVLEQTIVHCAVQLVPVLGHSNPKTRAKAVAMLFQLAVLLDPTVATQQSKVDRVSTALQVDERGYHGHIHELFHYLASPMSCIALPMISGLESLSKSSNWTTRGASISAMTRILFENEKMFGQDDHLRVVWNLFFTLGSNSKHRFFPDRIVVIKALGLLAPLYCLSDSSLTQQIVKVLLGLKDKTSAESEAIKGTLKKVFDKLGESANKDPKASGYQMFSDLLQSQSESAHDLLPWALETYTTSLVPSLREKGGGKKPVILAESDMIAFVEFLSTLQNHLQSASPLIRYSTCLCLHTALTLCPSLLSPSSPYTTKLVMGVADLDYLTAFLYTSLLPKITHSTPELSQDVENVIAQYRRQDLIGQSYDKRYMKKDVDVSHNAKSIDLFIILDAVIKYVPVPPKTYLSKAVSSLASLKPTQRLKSLDVIRAYVSQTPQIDVEVIDALLPLIQTSDSVLQASVVQVAKAILPSLSRAQPQDVSFVWHTMHPLLQSSTNEKTTLAMVELCSCLPLQLLNQSDRTELLMCLFDLAFDAHAGVRAKVYNVLSQCATLWETGSERITAIAILFLSLGDGSLECVKQISNYLTTFEPVIPASVLELVKLLPKASESGLRAVLKVYDDIANKICNVQTSCAPLVEVITADESVDRFWEFFLSDVPENQLVRPDDYSYTRNFVQAPFWISLLLCKFRLPPPPASTSGEVVDRRIVPASPASKRRFACGFMLCLMPTAGMPDPILRVLACEALVRCCFGDYKVFPGALKGLLENTAGQMLIHKQWTYQRSAIDIVSLLLLARLSNGISQILFHQYFDVALEWTANASSAIVKIGALKLAEVFLKVFPKATGAKIEELRDRVRTLIVDKENEIRRLACKLYPIIFKQTPAAMMEVSWNYLLSEIKVISKGGLAAAADPLVASLTPADCDHVIRTSIIASAYLPTNPVLSDQIVQSLLPYLHHSSPEFRVAAIQSILQHTSRLDKDRVAPLMWIVLPLYADPQSHVRVLFDRFLKRQPLVRNEWHIDPHGEDDEALINGTLEDSLGDESVITSNLQHFTDFGFLEDGEEDFFELGTEHMAEGYPRRQPLISTHLVSSLRQVAQLITSVLSPESGSQVVYYLQEMQKNRQLEASTILVLSELSSMLESAMPTIVDIMISHLANDVSQHSNTAMEACLIGLRNISENSPLAFKQVLGRLTAASAVTNEGDIIALLHISDVIAEKAAPKAVDVLRRYVPVISSARHSSRKRRWAVYLCVEMALLAGADEMMKLLDAIQAFMDAYEDEDDDNNLRIHVYSCLSRILVQLGPKHPFFRALIASAKKEARHKDVKIRLRALSIFEIFINHMTGDESMNFAILFLSDTDASIRDEARRVLAMEGLLEFCATKVRNLSVTASPSRNLSVSGSVSRGLSLAGGLGAPSEAGTNRSQFYDHGDSRASSSELLNKAVVVPSRGSKWNARFYGLPTGVSQPPAPSSVVKNLESKATPSMASASPDVVAKHSWALHIDPLVLLKECCKQATPVAEELVESLLVEVERAIRESGGQDESSDASDLESEVHAIESAGQILCALNGASHKASTYVDRLQSLLKLCNTSSESIREALFADLESSFFFFDETMDAPIVSEEQYQTFEAMKKLSQEATQEVVKTGKVDKLGQLEAKRNELVDVIDTESDRIRRFTVLSVHGTIAYAKYFAANPNTKPIEALEFLETLSSQEHWGIRMAAIESITMIANAHVAPGTGDIQIKVSSMLGAVVSRFETERSTLFRRKVDLLHLMRHLLNHSRVSGTTSPTLTTRIVAILLDLWTDVDQEVRAESIRMMQQMLEWGVPEAISLFSSSNSMSDKVTISGQASMLMARPEYEQKNELLQLLKWGFTHPMSKSRSPSKVSGSKTVLG